MANFDNTRMLTLNMNYQIYRIYSSINSLLRNIWDRRWDVEFLGDINKIIIHNVCYLSIVSGDFIFFN